MLKIIKITFFLFLICVALSGAKAAPAIHFYFIEPEKAEIGGIFSVQLKMQTGEFINALEGTVKFDASTLELESITDSSSVVTLWIESPALSGNGLINFSGIIPGGIGPVVSKENTVFDIKFKAKKVGPAHIELVDYLAYLHQPTAQIAEASASDLIVDIQPGTGTENGGKLILDFYPPEPFQVFLERNPLFFGNKYVLVFLTQDKESGIDHYEVRESFLGIPGEWLKTGNPHQLSHQSLFSIIEVRAYDKVGRERTEKIIPAEMVYLFLSALISLLFILVSLIAVFGIRIKKMRIDKL